MSQLVNGSLFKSMSKGRCCSSGSGRRLNVKQPSYQYNNSHSLRWRHNGHDGVSNHQPHHCLLNRLFGCWWKKTSKLCVTGLCAGNSPGTGDFPAQMARNAENFSIWLRHHVIKIYDHVIFIMEILIQGRTIYMIIEGPEYNHQWPVTQAVAYAN